MTNNSWINDRPVAPQVLKKNDKNPPLHSKTFQDNALRNNI